MAISQISNKGCRKQFTSRTGSAGRSAGPPAGTTRSTGWASWSIRPSSASLVKIQGEFMAEQARIMGDEAKMVQGLGERINQIGRAGARRADSPSGVGDAHRLAPAGRRGKRPRRLQHPRSSAVALSGTCRRCGTASACSSRGTRWQTTGRGLSPDTVLCPAEGLDFVLVSENELLVQFGTRSRPSELFRDDDVSGVIGKVIGELLSRSVAGETAVASRRAKASERRAAICWNRWSSRAWSAMSRAIRSSNISATRSTAIPHFGQPRGDRRRRAGRRPHRPQSAAAGRGAACR